MSKILEAKNLTILIAILFAVLFMVFTQVDLLISVFMLSISFVTIVIGVSQYGELEA